MRRSLAKRLQSAALLRSVWRLKKQNSFKPYRFYIIKDNNPQFLLSTIELTGEDLLENPSVAFKSKFEKHVKTVGVATMKEFDSYGLLIK